jgi:N-acetylglutamate synthase-like GNAT family acetyltransferase
MPQDSADNLVLRHARVDDVPQIAELTRPFVERRLLLRRTAADLRDLARNGFVVEDAGRVVGFAAVEFYSKKLAELQCLAVAEGYQGRGVGRRLVQACIDCAKEHKVLELMAITALDKFFMDCGFDYALPDQKRALFINTRPGVRQVKPPLS